MNSILKKALILITAVLVCFFTPGLFTCKVYAADEVGGWTAYPKVYHSDSVTPVDSEYGQFYVRKDGTPYYAYQTGTNIVFRMHNGSEWTYLGSENGYEIQNLFNMIYFGVAPNGTIYVAVYRKIGDAVYSDIYKLDGNSLIKVVSDANAKHLWFSDDGLPYYINNAGMGYINSSGQHVFIQYDSEMRLFEIAIDINGVPYVYSREQDGSFYVYRVYKYESGGFTQLGDVFTHWVGDYDFVEIETSPNGDLFIAFLADTVNDGYISKYDGSEWVEYIEAPFRVGYGNANRFRIDSSSNLYVMGEGNRIYKTEGTTWREGDKLDIAGGYSTQDFYMSLSGEMLFDIEQNYYDELYKYEFFPSIAVIENEALRLSETSDPIDLLDLGDYLYVTVDVTTSEATEVKAVIYDSSNQIVAETEIEYQFSGSVALTWDGKATEGNEAGLIAGEYVPALETGIDYTVKVHASNVAGDSSSSVMPLKIVMSKPLVIKPIIYDENMNSNSEIPLQFNLEYESALPCTAQASFFNSESQLVAALSFNPDTSTLPKLFPIAWDGKATADNEAGLTEGDPVPTSESGVPYTLVIRLTNNAGYTDTDVLHLKMIDAIPVTSVQLDIHEKTIVLGGSILLTAEVSPPDADFPQVTWSSDDENIALVDESGNVSAVSSGTAIITVTTDDGGFADTCNVTVIPYAHPYLTDLILDNGFIEGGFDENKKQFTINVQSNVTSIALTLVLSDTSGSASINGNETASEQPVCVDLIYGKNTVKILTALQDGTIINEYTLYIYRQAGEWVSVGGKVCNADSNTNPDIKINGGKPYVAWNGEGGYLYEYTGSAWESTPQIRPGIWLKDIALEFDEGVPYVGYLEGLLGHGRGYAAVKKYNGSSWTLLDSTGSTGSAEYFSMKMYNGTPYIAYIDDNNIYVQKYDGSDWSHVGDFSSYTNNPEYTALAIDQATGTPYIAYKSSEYKVIVRRFNGTDWEAVGDGVLFGSSTKICLEIENGTPYIGLCDRVYRVTESRWEDIGCPSDGANSFGDNFDFVTNEGKLCFIFGDAESDMVVLKTYNESGWTTVGATTQQGYKPELIFDNDEPYVVYLRYVDNWPAVFVDRFESLNIDTAKSYMSIAINTSADQLKSELAGEADEIKIYTTGGSEYFGDAVATGMVVKLIENEIVREERTAVVLGDVSNDGVINISDYTLVRLDILNLKPLADEYLLASDVNKDSFTNITDYTLIRLDILNLKSIHYGSLIER